MLTEKKKFIVGIACFQWGFVWAFHKLDMCPKSTQSPLLNILQLCFPTNQLMQPHSQSLNKYFCKGISYPPPPRYHKVYFSSMAEGNSSLQAQWEGEWRGWRGDETAAS
jgi:hypothetical protein